MEVKEIKKKLQKELDDIKKLTDSQLIDFIGENQIYRDFIYTDNGNKVGIEFQISFDFFDDSSISINSEYMELVYKKGREIIETLPLGRELGAKIKNYIYDMYLAWD